MSQGVHSLLMLFMILMMMFLSLMLMMRNVAGAHLLNLLATAPQFYDCKNYNNKKLQQYVTENTTVPLVLTLFIGVDDEN